MAVASPSESWSNGAHVGAREFGFAVNQGYLMRIYNQPTVIDEAKYEERRAATRSGAQSL